MPELQTQAPEGAHFDFEEVKTAKGTQSLGEVPILIWDSVSAAIAYYGEEAVRDVLDGTSLRVSFQSIARRYAGAKKSIDEIAKAQIDFRPGKRAGGASTPVSRAQRAAKSAAEKVGDGDALAQLLEKVAAGEIDLASLGITVNPTANVAAGEVGEGEEEEQTAGAEA